MVILPLGGFNNAKQWNVLKTMSYPRFLNTKLSWIWTCTKRNFQVVLRVWLNLIQKYTEALNAGLKRNSKTE